MGWKDDLMFFNTSVLYPDAGGEGDVRKKGLRGGGGKLASCVCQDAIFHR